MEISKRVYGLLKTTFSPQSEEASSSSSSNGSTSIPNTPRAREMRKMQQSTPTTQNGIVMQNGSFIYNYLNGRLKKREHQQVYYGKTGVDLPKLYLEQFCSKIYAAHTGPDGGLTEVPSMRKEKVMGAALANLDDEFNHFDDADSICSSSAADIGALKMGEALAPSSSNDNFDILESEFEPAAVDYNRPCDRAFGASISLYEHPPTMKTRSGEPVADCFGIVARRNHCVMALADGVNWGVRARLAAQCAIRGALEHLQTYMQGPSAPANTQELFHILLAAFHTGHQLILQQGGLLTTLCAAVVCKLKDSACWVVCACNVGDSLCFVNGSTGTRELTLGSHDITSMRDMRDAGGALGPVDGLNPELNNLTCSMTFVDEGDIVFITSDGVSDNFDPVVGRFCVIADSAQNTPLKNARLAHRTVSQPPPTTEQTTLSVTNEEALNRPNMIPVVSAHQRHELMLLRMDDLLNYGVSRCQTRMSNARQLVNRLIDFVTQLTKAKRAFLEDPDLYISKEAQRRMQTHVKRRMSELPGKLDHATVVAYQVGIWPDTNDDTTPHDTPAKRETVITPLDGMSPIEDNLTWPSDSNDNSASDAVPADATTLTKPVLDKAFTPGSLENSIIMMDDGASMTSSTYARFKKPSMSHETICCELKSPSIADDDCILVITQEERTATKYVVPDSPTITVDINIAQQSKEHLEGTLIQRRSIERHRATINDQASICEYAKSERTMSLASTSAPTPPTSLDVKRKHARGSNSRHTVSVDIQWLKRLVPHKRDTVDDEQSQFQRQSPHYASGKKWRSKLRLPWKSDRQQSALTSTPEDNLDEDVKI